MDALSLLFRKAEEERALSLFPIHQGIPQRMSVHEDDVILFLKPSQRDAVTVAHILEIFGNSSGLKCNLKKSSISPLISDEVITQETSNILRCQVRNFPIICLGLPLHLKKVRKEDSQALIDIIRNQLAAWKTFMLTHGGRLILVEPVLSAIAIFHLLSLDPPPWVFKAIDKIRRAFLWKGTDAMKGGKFLVNWNTICHPKPLGGFGIF
jgi:hypothetical protein